jgi:hypothetical protein
MIQAPATAFRFQSTASLPRVEPTLLSSSTSNALITDVRAHRDIPCSLTFGRAAPAGRFVRIAHIAARGYRRRRRWAHRQVQFP